MSGLVWQFTDASSLSIYFLREAYFSAYISYKAEKKK